MSGADVQGQMPRHSSWLCDARRLAAAVGARVSPSTTHATGH